MRINNNIAALNTYRQLSANNVNTGKSLEKLSSGLRINRAGDDAAGLAISEKMRAQIRGLDQASRNSQDAISLIQTAEGALSETQSILQRMRELAVQSASDTNVSLDRESIQNEINSLTSEINRIGSTTEFNTQKLLNGDKVNDFTVTGTSFASGASSQSLLGGTGTLLIGSSALNSGTYTLEISKSISGSTVTVATESGLNDTGVVLTDTLAEVTYGGSGFKPTFAGDAIAIAAADSGNIFASAAGSGSISITLDSGDRLIVNILSSSGIQPALTSTDVILRNASGAFTYNNHGVTFTITDTTAWDSGALSAVTYNKSGGVAIDNSVGTAQSLWTSVTLGSGATNTTVDGILTGVAIGADAAGGDYTIKFINSGTVGRIVITMVSGADGLSGSVLDTVSGINSSGAFTYNNHGISFTVTLSGLGSVSGTASGDIAFSVRKAQSVDVDVYQTSYTATVKDANGATVTGASGIALGSSALASGSGAAAGSGADAGISAAFSGDLAGLHMSFASGTAITTGSGSFEVNQTTTGDDFSLTFQIGANQAQSMSLSINDMRAAALAVSSSAGGAGFASSKQVTDGTSASLSEFSLNVSTASGAANAITVINDAINLVSQERSKLGAVQNRLEHTINNLGTSSENLTAAESRVRDVDMARQMMEFTKNNILTQAAQSMLAQANQQPQGVLQLLR